MEGEYEGEEVGEGDGEEEGGEEGCVAEGAGDDCGVTGEGVMSGMHHRDAFDVQIC